MTAMLLLGRILLANSNQRYFNKLVKIPCHKTPYRCPHRLNLSSQSSRSCAGPNIKVLKDKDLEFANSIGRFLHALPKQMPQDAGRLNESARPLGTAASEESSGRGPARS